MFDDARDPLNMFAVLQLGGLNNQPAFAGFERLTTTGLVLCCVAIAGQVSHPLPDIRFGYYDYESLMVDEMGIDN